MKKIKWIAAFLIVATLFAVIGCNNPSGPSGSGNGGSSGEQTGGGTQGVAVPEGFVLVKGATVTGALPAWLDESADDYYKGVFIEGRTVTLSDFYMGKYEVTQEEYASVMTGQKVTVDGVEYTLASDPSYCKKDSTSYTLFEGEEQGKRPVEGVTWYDAVWYCLFYSMMGHLLMCIRFRSLLLFVQPLHLRIRLGLLRIFPCKNHLKLLCVLQ